MEGYQDAQLSAISFLPLMRDAPLFKIAEGPYYPHYMHENITRR